MGAIRTIIDTGFRDYQVASDPTSGAYEPEKSAIRALGPLLEYAIARAGLGALVSDAKATAAELSLVAPDKAVALVFSDITDANNDLWVKSGDAGAGTWTNTGALHSIMDGLAQPFADEFEDIVQDVRAVVPAVIVSDTEPVSSHVVLWFKTDPASAFAPLFVRDAPFRDTGPPVVVSDTEPTADDAAIWFRTDRTTVATLWIKEAS